MAVDTVRKLLYNGAPLTVGVTTPNPQGDFLINTRVEAMSNFTLSVFTTGGASYSMQLEGSCDNQHWSIIGAAVSADGIYNLSGGGSYYTWCRLNITAVSGGTSPTVTAAYVAVS